MGFVGYRKVIVEDPSAMPITPPQVRSGLTAGGSWIRTFGSARDRLRFEALSLVGRLVVTGDNLLRQVGYEGLREDKPYSGLRVSADRATNRAANTHARVGSVR